MTAKPVQLTQPRPATWIAVFAAFLILLMLVSALIAWL